MTSAISKSQTAFAGLQLRWHSWRTRCFTWRSNWRYCPTVLPDRRLKQNGTTVPRSSPWMVTSCLYGCGAVLKVPSKNTVSHWVSRRALPSVRNTTRPQLLSRWDKWRLSRHVRDHCPWMLTLARVLGTAGKHSPRLRRSRFSTNANDGTASAAAAGALAVTVS